MDRLVRPGSEEQYRRLLSRGFTEQEARMITEISGLRSTGDVVYPPGEEPGWLAAARQAYEEEMAAWRAQQEADEVE